MDITIDSGVTLSSVTTEIEEQLSERYSVVNPEYATRIRLRLPRWGVPPRLYCCVRTRDGYRLPRGVWQSLIAEGSVGHVVDRRITIDTPLEGVSEPALRPYQEQAVRAMLAREQGVIVVPCGGGKTRIALGAIARIGQPTLVIVHTLDLAEQWRRELELVGIEAGLIGGGKRRQLPVTIALVQSLTRWPVAQLDTLLASFGVLIVDECHHVPSATFRLIVDRSPSRCRFGLTATPEREDGLTAMLGWYFGPTLATVTHEELVRAGVLVVPAIRAINTEFHFAYMRPEDYPRLCEALVSDRARNELIARTVAEEARGGHLCLVLSTRVDHCKLLAAAISDHGIGVELLTGVASKARRTEILDGARAGNISVLVATTLADEGLDLPSLSRVFLAFPARARGRTQQRVGRLMRTHEGKAGALLYDFVDRAVYVLRHQYAQRRRTYVEILG